jgi:hypothetical protein
LGPNRLQPQELKEYSDNYLVLDYLGPILGSKCLVMQTMGNYLRLSRAQTFGGDLGEDVSGCHLVGHHKCRWSAGQHRLPAKKYLQIKDPQQIQVNLFPRITPNPGISFWYLPYLQVIPVYTHVD